MKRYNLRGKQFEQNRLFASNQKQFFRSLGGEEGGVTEQPNAQEVTEFWSNLWGVPVTHNDEARWVSDVERELIGVRKQETITVTKEKVAQNVRKIPNWKAPGPDGIQGYWLKNFPSLHTRIGNCLNSCLLSGKVPNWMVEGRTTLIMKDKTKGPVVGNYRPIACLNLLWKLLTGIMSDETYNHLL